MRLICNDCNKQYVVYRIVRECPNPMCHSGNLNFVSEPIWISRAIVLFKNAPANIISIPYTFLESLNWGLKHINIYFSWPLSLLIIFNLIFIFNFLPFEWYLTILAGAVLGMISIAHYLSRKFYKHHYPVKLFGKHDEQQQLFKGTLNRDVRSPKYWIGFVGDIMPMEKYDLDFSDDLMRFFEGTELVVGNLEGIIAPEKAGTASKKHESDIFEKLLKLHKNWLICMSNNHSGDFGYTQFIETCKKAVEADIRIELFGFRTIPCYPDYKYISTEFLPGFLKLMDKVNIVSGTMWRNHSKSCNYISLYEWKNSYYDRTKFNILYPHWHYENEDYVRLNIQEKCNDLMRYGDDCNQEKPWDLIFGHHPHVPQAITMIESSNTQVPNKLLAYSGGNFTSGVWRDKHNHGMIMKCEIGRWTNGKLAVGDVYWSYTKNDFVKWKIWKKEKVKTVSIDNEQNSKKSYFIIRKRILYNVYVSFLIVPIVIAILVMLGFEIDVARFFINLGFFQIGFFGYIVIAFHRRRKYYTKTSMEYPQALIS